MSFHNHTHEEGHLCDDCKAELKEDIHLMITILHSPAGESTRDLADSLLYSFLMELYGVCDCEDPDEDDDEESDNDSPVQGPIIGNLREFLTAMGTQHHT